jgi:hypothetical protein
MKRFPPVTLFLSEQPWEIRSSTQDPSLSSDALTGSMNCAEQPAAANGRAIRLEAVVALPGVMKEPPPFLGRESRP